MNRSRRCLIALVAVLLGPALGEIRVNAQTMTVYVGTYTGPKSKGIYAVKFDPATGALSTPEVAAEFKNPSPLTIHPNTKDQYAIGEVDNFQGKKGGVVAAYSIDPA